jgi:predicted anti-sigma-YlaC factor YlaD
MNNCTQLDIQEMLPDLLHRTLDQRSMERVEAHLASCESCTEELGVLRTVSESAIFAPVIDIDGIVRRIPPYQRIVPVKEAPARSRLVSWLVAASMLIVVAGGGSLLMVQQNQKTQTVASAESEVAPAGHALALAAGVDALSDDDLRQLMTDMSSFDALPSADPEPVISVDATDNSDQGD